MSPHNHLVLLQIVLFYLMTSLGIPVKGNLLNQINLDQIYINHRQYSNIPVLCKNCDDHDRQELRLMKM